MPISVVIVAFQSGPALLRCLESLNGQEGLIETIVVDNGGGGSEIDEVRASNSVRVVSPDGNLGFAAGANLGAAESSGEVIITSPVQRLTLSHLDLSHPC